MVVVKANGDRLELVAPFHPDLSAQAKRLDGRWRGQEVGWVFRFDREPDLRALCIRMWGVDGTPDAVADVVQLQIEVECTDIRSNVWVSHDAPVYLVGREIAASLKNGRAARRGRGVKFLRGRPGCKVELNHTITSIPHGSVFVLDATPRMAIKHIERALTGHGRCQVLAAA